MKQRIKVAIGIPDKGITDAGPYDNHLELLGHLGKLEILSSIGKHEFNGVRYEFPDDVEFQFNLITIARIFPALARERIAEHAQDAGCDYLFMFDDDMFLPPDTFERLFAHRKDIIAPLAFTRLAPIRPVIYNLTKGYDAVSRQDYYMNLCVLNYPKNTLVECDAVGFGAVLIDMKLFKTMKKPWFMTTSGAGEDIHFCHNAGKDGFHIFCDTSVKLGHLGEGVISNEELYESVQDIAGLRKIYGDEVKYRKEAK